MTSNLNGMTVLRTTTPLQVKLAGANLALGAVEGYASTFGGEPDSYGDVIAPGAFANSLSDHRARGTVPVMLWGHNPNEPIGRWTELHEDSRGLFVRGQLNLETDRGSQAHAHLKAGDVGSFSIGYRVASNGMTTNADGTFTLRELELFEISVVSVPANRHARVTSVKSIGSQVELERLLRDAGLARGAAVKLASGGWPALSQEPDISNQDVEQFAARISAATLELKKG